MKNLLSLIAQSPGQNDISTVIDREPGDTVLHIAAANSDLSCIKAIST